MIFVRDFGEMIEVRAVLSHVFFARFTEQLGGNGTGVDTGYFGHHLHVFVHRIGTVEKLEY